MRATVPQMEGQGFWAIDVETVNQRGEWAGTETYSFLGYRRPEAQP